MFEKIRGQLRHILGLVGAIIAAKYVNEGGLEVFNLQWELVIAFIMMVGPMVDSWLSKKGKDSA